MALVRAADSSCLFDLVSIVVEGTVENTLFVGVGGKLTFLDWGRALLEQFGFVGASFCEELLFRVPYNDFLLVLFR
jgi:hypothetical protein